MSDYNLISIGSVYLTSDGTSMGNPCRTKVHGHGKLLNTYTGQIQKNLKNVPIAQVTPEVEAGVGEEISIEIRKLTIETLGDIQDEINAAYAASTTLNVVSVGTVGTFNLETLAKLPDAISDPSDVDEDYIYGITITFTVAGIN